MKLLKKIFGFVFGKSGNDCVNCIYGTSTGHGYPCCECDGTKYYKDKNEILQTS